MRSPRKIRRIERQYVQGGRAVPINIVSMIDIFAILVFYLLVSIAAVEMRPSDASLQLPKSSSREHPPEATQLMITAKSILVDNKPVMDTGEALNATTDALPALKAALEAKVELKIIEGDQTGGLTRGDVNILADKSIPYLVLKKVMTTCSQAKFARSSLAVVERKATRPAAVVQP